MINFSDRPLGYDNFRELYKNELLAEWDEHIDMPFEEVVKFCYESYIDSFIDLYNQEFGDNL